MTHDPFADDQNTIPIADAEGDESATDLADGFDDASSAAPGDLPPPEAFTPKEIQAHVFSASVQIYNTRPEANDYPAQYQSVMEAVSIFAIAGNKTILADIFEKITAANAHPYDVFARAEAEIEGMFRLPSDDA